VALRLIAVLAGGLALACWSAPAAAQIADEAPPAPAPPPLVAPRAIEAGTVPYPQGAHGEASVIVEVSVGRDGHVQNARIIEGPEPFASAVLAAAPSWTYEPARRGDVTVVARVRMLVQFTPPIPTPTPTPTPGAPPTSPNQPPAPPAKVEEVQVRGARHEAGETTMSGGEVRQMPGAFGDAFRAMEALPGVTPIVSGLPYFFVRGAPPGNTGYYIDGIRVPILYHFAAGPSVIHPGLVDHVDFYPGGYPARYGRFAGGVLAGETLAPANRLHGEGNLRLYDIGALIESPIAQGRGTLLASGRYGYPGLIVSLVSPEARLSYWDYQARATWDLGKRDRVGAFFFGSYDFLGEYKPKQDETNTIFETEFHRIDLRWDHQLSDTGQMRTALTVGWDQTSSQGDFAVRDRMIGARMHMEERLSRDVRLRGGADVWLDHYDIAPTGDARDDAKNEILYPPRNDVAWGLWADLVWKLHPRVEIVPGVRADLFGSTRTAPPPLTQIDSRGRTVRVAPIDASTAAPAVDPRLAVRVTLARSLTSISTFGISHQPPSFFVPIPGLQIGRLDKGLQTSVQTSQGLEIGLPEDFTVTPTLFVHNYLGLTDLTASCVDSGGGADVNDDCVERRVRGRTYGFELLLKRSLTKRFTGWLAYTLSRTTRESHPIGSVERTQEVPGEFDRTHVLSLIAAHDLGRRWRVGGRFFFYTGRPYSNRIQGVLIPPFNTERLPNFYRLDLRLEKRWVFSDNKWISFVVEWLNTTLRKEATSVECTQVVPRIPPGGVFPTTLPYDDCQPQYIGPITIPSIGVEAGF
jgi:TonB family protein